MSTNRMDIKNKSVRLSAAEAAYLSTATFLPKQLLEIIETARPADDDRFVLKVSHIEAEQLRACLTEHLAQVGFGIGYNTLPEGELLEELIDRFYLDGDV